jgi:AraC-like DNA-binding protein
MSYKISEPPEYLRPFVQYFWQADFHLDNKESFTHISTASSCAGLQFYFDGGFKDARNSSFENFQKTAVFHGQTNGAQDFVTNGSAGIFGVKFYPYAIPALFAMPANELTNQMLTLNLLLGRTGNELAESIFTSNNFLERVGLMVRFLTKQIRLTKQLDGKIINAVHAINVQNGNTNTESLSKTVFLSQRQFERKFKEMVGFSPKSYAKIVRFEYAKNCFETNPQSLTDIAISCGYYDQAHFNHDFKTLCGYSPKEYYHNYSQIKLNS